MEKILTFNSKYTFCLLIMALFFTLTVHSQAREENFSSPSNTSSKKKKKFEPERLVFGGGLGAQFGSITSVQIAPTLGYLFTDDLLAGISGKYIYYEEDYQLYSYKTNMYGGGVFAQYFFLEYLIAHVEYELLNLDAYNAIDNSKERVNVNSIFVGGGLRSTIGGNSFASIMILYNLNDDIYSPYINPIFRVSFGIGL